MNKYLCKTNGLIPTAGKPKECGYNSVRDNSVCMAPSDVDCKFKIKVKEKKSENG